MSDWLILHDTTALWTKGYLPLPQFLIGVHTMIEIVIHVMFYHYT